MCHTWLRPWSVHVLPPSLSSIFHNDPRGQSSRWHGYKVEERSLVLYQTSHEWQIKYYYATEILAVLGCDS